MRPDLLQDHYDNKAGTFITRACTVLVYLQGEGDAQAGGKCRVFLSRFPVKMRLLFKAGEGTRGECTRTGAEREAG